MLTWVKKLFGQEEVTRPDPWIPVLKIIRDAIARKDQRKLCDIFDCLTPEATTMAMERLDHVERHLVLAALKTQRIGDRHESQ